MRPGQYDAAGHQTLDMQLEDLFPEFDDLNVPYDLALYDERVFPVVFGVTAVRATASDDTWQPGGSPPFPPPEESPPAAQLLDVSEPGSWSRPGSQ